MIHFYGGWGTILILLAIGMLIENRRIRWLAERKRTKELQAAIKAKLEFEESLAEQGGIEILPPLPETVSFPRIVK